MKQRYIKVKWNKTDKIKSKLFEYTHENGNLLKVEEIDSFF